MSLEIGFDLYNKEDFLEKGALVTPEEAKGLDFYSSGRCSINEAWGDLFNFNLSSTAEDSVYLVPVFQKELDGKVYYYKNEEGKVCSTTNYKYVDLKDFMSRIEEEIEEVETTQFEYRMMLFDQNRKLEKKIKSLRELQKTCTEDNAYAFSKWTEEITNLEERIENNEYQINHDTEDDYDYTKAQEMKDLLNSLEKYVKEDKYFVIPFFSF